MRCLQIYMGPQNSGDSGCGDLDPMKMGLAAKLGVPKTYKICNLGTLGVAMARPELILSQHGATSLRKVSEYLPSLRDAILIQKQNTNINIQIFY